jgi:hypothetical protein
MSKQFLGEIADETDILERARAAIDKHFA